MRVREYVYVIHIQDKISKTGVRNISVVSKDTRDVRGWRDVPRAVLVRHINYMLDSYDRQIVSQVQFPRSANKFKFAFQWSGSTFQKENGYMGDVDQFIVNYFLKLQYSIRVLLDRGNGLYL